MKRALLGLILLVSCAVTGGGATLIAAAASGGATAAQVCPSIGSGSGCAYVLTVNPSGSVTITAGASSQAYDGGGRGEGDDYVVGVVNNSNAVVSKIALSGSNQVFGFDSDGMCTYTFTSPVSSSYCQTNGPGGGPSYTTTRGRTTGTNPYDYQGPNNTFTNLTTSGRSAGNSGTINFTTPLLPQGTTFLSLENSPLKNTATATLQPGMKVAAPALTPPPLENNAWSGQVTTFTDQGSISPASEFQATINWGDGSSSAGTLTQASPGSYVVSGTHTYAEEGSDAVSVTVTDPPLLQSAAGKLVATVTSTSTSVVVADAPLTPGPAVVIGPQQTNVAFTTSATFTDGDPTAPLSDFVNTTISWGDGTTSTTSSATNPVVITGSGGAFTVSGSHAYGANTVDDPNGAEPNPVTFSIVDVGGSTTTVNSNNVVVADSVTSCAGTTCSGTVNPTATQPVSATVGTSDSQTGQLLLSTNPNSGASELNCGDGFLHAPTVLSETNTFSAPQGTITSTESFPVADGVILNSAAPGPPGDSTAFWVCFQATQSFTDVSGQSAAQSTDASGATVYTGLLPLCDPLAGTVALGVSHPADPGPCVNYISTAPNGSSVLTVTEVITYPATFATSGDPKRI
jgi:hypothetical protein